jgi:Ca2+-binding RTX toxin-like protein
VWRDYRDTDLVVPDWAFYEITDLFHSFAIQDGQQHPDVTPDSFGDDYIAGGPGDDTLFGQLGDDTIQGDGSIDSALAVTWTQSAEGGDAFTRTTHAAAPVGAWRTTPAGCATDEDGGVVCDLTGVLVVNPSFEAETDGDDYIEGGGGNDVIFGGLGQDDIIGGSSNLFSLTDRDQRPDGDDIIFGGAGTRIGRNEDVAPADTIFAERHARDADTIVGDNGNIYRLVGINGVDVKPGKTYLTFVYDTYSTTLRIVPRAVELLDYTLGGPDLRPGRFSVDDTGTLSSTYDIWGNDQIFGEAGNDDVSAGGGADVIYGGSEDDNLIGGWGNDWISGGTGQDGILGDDGRIFTSRNATTGFTATGAACSGPGTDAIPCYSEPLYGVRALRPTDPDTKRTNGDVLNEYIYTPGHIQTAIINVAGALAKAVDLTPFGLDPVHDDPLFRPRFADDIIFGGLGNDFLHGGAGDDAISGGEALPVSYAQHICTGDEGIGCTAGQPYLILLDYDHPWNPGDILEFGDDTDSWQQDRLGRNGEFRLYDEYDPRRAILFNPDGTVWKDGPAPVGRQFFLNFLTDEGVLIPGCTSSDGTCISAERHSDGDDVIFGDHGNDWLVGGTGRDTLWGGWGNDLLNADDDLSTNGWLNDVPDTHPCYEDRVVGGAGLDILIGNTGGDRLIDWVGEFNSYIVPFAPFGIATVSRQVPPGLYEFLYALSGSQGADPTRATDQNKLDPTLAARHGEPYGEIGVVTQKDRGLWQEQTGGPTDPQPGNIPGGPRDVLRSANFNDGQLQGFFVDSGAFTVTKGALNVTAAELGGDAVAVFYVDDYLPIYYEVTASILLVKPTAGWKANAYVVFDYHSPTDFKFAGIDQSTNKLVLGRRVGSQWIVDAWKPLQVKFNTWYQLLIAVNGTTVTVVLDGTHAFTYTFAARVLEGEEVGLNKGMVGVGSDNSRGWWDNIAVQVLPPQIAYDHTETFADGPGVFTGPQQGSWQVPSPAEHYLGTPDTPSQVAYSLADPGGRTPSYAYVELSTDVTLGGAGVAGIVFDHYGANDFKFAGIDVATGRVVIGHVSPNGGWKIDVSSTRAFTADTTYTLLVVLKGASVSIQVSGAFGVSWGFNSDVVDGRFGTFTQAATATFDDFRIRSSALLGDGSTPPPSTTPSVSVGDAVVTEGPFGGTNTAVLQITLSAPAVGGESVSWTTADRTATAGLDYVAASGTITFVAGQTSATIVIEIIGDGLAEGDETLTVTLSDPVGLSLGRAVATVTILDDDQPPTTPVVTVTAPVASTAEGSTIPATIELTRTGDLTSPLTVALVWSGTATASTDYSWTVIGGTLAADRATATFEGGSSSITITIHAVDDTEVEDTESVIVHVMAGSGYDVGTPDSATVTIADNDAPPPTSLPTLSIDDITVTEGDRGTSNAVLTISLSAPATTDVTVRVTTVDGTATVKTDYRALNTTITIRQGATTATVTVQIVGDKVAEPTESFTVVLSDLTGQATLDKAVGTVTIIDNDARMVAASLPEQPVSDGEALTAEQVQPLFQAALAAWAARGEEPGVLAALTFEIIDLDGTVLAETVGTTIALDATAAGWGWYVDPTPGTHDGFVPRGGVLIATAGSAAAERIDLWTVLMHEIGHALGYEHDTFAPGSELGRIMDGVLEPGVRRSFRSCASVPRATSARVLSPGARSIITPPGRAERQSVAASTPRSRGWTDRPSLYGAFGSIAANRAGSRPVRVCMYRYESVSMQFWSSSSAIWSSRAGVIRSGSIPT